VNLEKTPIPFVRAQGDIQEVFYRRPAGWSLVEARRPHALTPQGGRVLLDDTLRDLWLAADGQSLADVVAASRTKRLPGRTIRAALACLAEAGLLARSAPETHARPEPVRGRLVSAVIVAFNGRHWLAGLLPTLVAQTYSPIEVIVVDNGSTDGTADWLSRSFPAIRVIVVGAPRSFAHAVNRGVAAANGDYLFLLNQDVRLEPDTLSCLVRVAGDDPSCAAVATKLKFQWAPAFLNGLGNRVREHSWGSDNAIGHLDLGQFDDWRTVPSACFAAALVSRQAISAVGALDEGFPMYYEDSEWCYRARALGFEVRVAPQAVAYHAFGGSVPTGDEERLPDVKLRRVVYGRLRFTLKLLHGRWRRRFLANYLREDLANLRRSVATRDFGSARAYAAGWWDAAASLPDIGRQRRTLAPRLVRDDEALLAAEMKIPDPVTSNGLPILTRDLVENHYLPLMAKGKTRPMPEFPRGRPKPQLLIVSNDVVDTKMAGPGMRYLEMARALSRSLDVVLAVPADTSLEENDVHLVRYWEDRPGSVQVLMENSDVALISGYMADKFPFLASVRTPLVVDLYDPFVLENLHYYRDEPLAAQESLNDKAVEMTNRLADLGDFFICGNERQRDFWLGLLAADRRITPTAFLSDPSLRQLIDVVGIGVPERRPTQRAFLAGKDPRVPKDARIVLWGGGIWNWLDPLTLIRAWPAVVEQQPNARLVLLGTRHPNPTVPVHEMARRAQDLATEIGEKDRTIIFIEWVAYEDREALLSEASVGVTLHPMHAETRYSMRTRVLDYLWARLPVVITEGDTTAEWISSYQLGKVVPAGDREAVATALLDILSVPKETFAPRFSPLLETLTWAQVVEPLKAFCLTARRTSRRSPPAPESHGKHAARILYEQGPRAFLVKGSRVVRRRLLGR
jgi:GT2 family glycosyltransferase